MRKVGVRLGSNSYEIHIGSGISSQLGSWLKENGFCGKVVIITNPIVQELYGDILKQNLFREGFEPTTLLVPEGEEQKSLETASRLYNELADFGAERTTPILALGGGVIGDLAGFVAATYLRGVPLVQIPTSLLAQVDSSIGGKVAVDHGQLKNMVGTFYQPKLVVADIAALQTISPEEISDGLAEVIKYAVIWDEEFFSYLERNLDKIKLLKERVIEAIVFKSAKIKAKIIEKDERDFGLRNILNYGHTLGHAVESASDFQVGHGQAIALGMLMEARIANKLGIFSKDELIRLKNLIQRADLPTKVPNLNVARVIEAMKHDKKVRQGKIRFVLPKCIGSVFILDEVSLSLVEQVLVAENEEA